MQFLLVALNAKYIHSNPALYSLRSFAGENKRYVQIAEYTINNRMEEILEDIYQRKPDVIGFSCYIWNWDMIQDIVIELHKLLPEVPIWLGGPEVSFDAEEILIHYPVLTGIMIGEGEETFAELLQYYVSGQGDVSQIAGLVTKEGRTDYRNSLLLTQIPFLYDNISDFQNRIIYYESQRGCPFRCSYCLSSIDKSVRFRDISVVKEELQFFLDHNVKQVKFVDRTFNCNHEHAMAVWSYIQEHDNSVTNFHFEIAGDILNDEEIALLHTMRPGLVQLEIGVQSVNSDTLKEIRRVMDIEKLKQVTASIREGNNIHQHLDLIAGLPFENYESFGHSFDEVYAMGPNQLQLGFLKVLKGSYMHEKAGDYGLKYMDKPPYEVLFTNWLSFAEIRKLKKIEEMVEIYYNSNQFTNTLRALLRLFKSPFAMFEALADYYAQKGYFIETPSRVYRYQVLSSFAETLDEKRSGLYRELLTFDMYLRENLKSRPDFTKDLQPYKRQISLFYKMEEVQRFYLQDYDEYDSRQLERMTHLEPFRYSVWSSLKNMPVKEKSEDADDIHYVLFDYKHRDPLTYEAKVFLIPGEKME
ncbi:MAG TPA: B12-binding domain-containing radical SAM protein [Lachnospiraceae bacterium]|nr:B12-binding domain-containing radical SAM protein [Lachnospiraceae bacterium]